MPNCTPALEFNASLGECPRWHARERRLYWVDIDACALHRFDPAGGRNETRTFSQPVGCFAFVAGGGFVLGMKNGFALLADWDAAPAPFGEQMLAGRPPFEGENPSDVMHKHLKKPLVPPDHINTALSAGVGEIIEVAMAKNRDERYGRTEDMLEDLQAVRNNQPPVNARRAVDLDSLAKIEETGKTVDIFQAPPAIDLWSQPLFIVAITVGGVSIVVNLILILLLVMK